MRSMACIAVHARCLFITMLAHKGGLLYVCLLVFFSFSTFVLAQNTGSISGTLAGDDGATITGVVIANGVGVAASGRAVSAADGTFNIPNLPAGTYVLCGRPKGRGYLDPCIWSTDPPKVSVTAGQATANTKLVLAKGAVIDVRVNDPSQVLGAAALPNATGALVLLEAMTPRGPLEPLVINAKDTLGMDLQTTIPFNTQIAISVTGNQVKLTDSAGKVVNPSASSITVQRGPNDAPTAITLQVSKP
jgi:hypothetical protein